jgi:hypothetical protein
VGSVVPKEKSADAATKEARGSSIIVPTTGTAVALRVRRRDDLSLHARMLTLLDSSDRRHGRRRPADRA